MRRVIASLVLLAACASSGMPLSEGNEGRVVSIVTVRNQRSENLTIYVMHDGYRGRRLGEVNGFGSATFVLRELDAPPATDLQFLAVSFSTGISNLSDPVQLVRGTSYEWRVVPTQSHQLAVRRYAT